MEWIEFGRMGMSARMRHSMWKALALAVIFCLARWAGMNGRTRPWGSPRPFLDALQEGIVVLAVVWPLFYWLIRGDYSEDTTHPDDVTYEGVNALLTRCLPELNDDVERARHHPGQSHW